MARYEVVGPALVVGFLFAVAWVVCPAVCMLMGWM